ncbi:tetratricopeptide repeat protein [Thalassotalea agariperforans]
MLYRLFWVLLIAVFSLYCRAEQAKENLQEYIDLAISLQKTKPAAAYSALEKAYLLAKKQNNTALIAKILLEQAQTAKLSRDYFLAQQYLNKAEDMLPILNSNELSVYILTNMSTIQLYLKNPDSSMEYVQRALAIASESREPKLIFRCLQIKGSLLQKIKRFDDSVTAFLSAQRYISSVPYTDQVSLLRDIANAYNKVNEHMSGIRYYKKALGVLTEQNELSAMPNTLIELAKTYAKIGDYSEALESAKRSLALAREYKEEKEELKSLVVLSIIYRKLSSYEEALHHGLEALAIYQKNDDINGIAAAANAVGLIYTHLEQAENSKSYFIQVINLPEHKINAKYRAAALRGLGKLIFMEEQNHRGLELSNEAFTIYEKIGDRNGVATVQKNIGYIYSQMGNLSEAILAYQTAITIFQSLSDVWNEAESKAYLSTVLVDVDIQQAVSFAQSSLALATQIGAKSIAVQAYSALILAEEKRENYQQALSYSKKKQALNDEIKTDAINQRLAEIHIILDIENKEKAFELLKREKAFISLELANKENQLHLLEKEKTITDLKTQNTYIILTIVTFCVLLCLVKMKRGNSNIRYGCIIAALILVTFLLYSFNANAVDIIKLTQSESDLDVRPKYTLAVLNKALALSSDKYGPYKIEIIEETIFNEQKIISLHDGEDINLAMAMTSPDWEYLALPIRIPIRRGVGSYRLLTINKNNSDKFANISTLAELKLLTTGVQKDWIMNTLLEDEGFILIEGLTYDSIFKMLDRQRFDYLLRGIHEAYDEISLRKHELKNLMIEPNLAIYIPQPYYIFVSPKYPKIAERIEYGLEKMISAGILQQMFDDHYAAFIKKANLSNRKIINIGNKYLPQKTPVDRKELWLKFDFESKLKQP